MEVKMVSLCDVAIRRNLCLKMQKVNKGDCIRTGRTPVDVDPDPGSSEGAVQILEILIFPDKRDRG